MRPPLIGTDELARALVHLPGWSVIGNLSTATDGAGLSLRRQVTAQTFLAGVEWVRLVALRAEAADHHPQTSISAGARSRSW